MSHNSDQFRMGTAGMPGDTTAPMPAAIPLQGGGVYGGPVNAIATAIDIVPIAITTTGLATAQTISNANWTLTAGSGFTTTSINNVNYIDMGCNRSVIFTGGATTVTAVLTTVTGKDSLLRSLSCTFTGPVSTNAVETVKTFRYVAGAFTTGNTTSAVSIGPGDTYGFEHVCSSAGYIISANWSGNIITSSAGFTVADMTSPATSGTGDVRGKYKVQTQSSNGAARLAIFQYLSTNSSLATVSGVYGVTPA